MKILNTNFYIKLFKKKFIFNILETGKYVAIDLSGKNLRILLLTLNGREEEPNVVTTNFIVSNAIMKGTGEQVNYLLKFYDFEDND